MLKTKKPYSIFCKVALSLQTGKKNWEFLFKNEGLVVFES